MITKAEDWNDIHRGDIVKVAGERGTFEFLAYVTTSAGHAWVDVFGPVGKDHRENRSFTPGRIQASCSAAK